MACDTYHHWGSLAESASPRSGRAIRSGTLVPSRSKQEPLQAGAAPSRSRSKQEPLQAGAAPSRSRSKQEPLQVLSIPSGAPFDPHRIRYVMRQRKRQEPPPRMGRIKRTKRTPDGTSEIFLLLWYALFSPPPGWDKAVIAHRDSAK